MIWPDEINGEIYLKGREDQIIVSGGKNISINKVKETLETLDIGINYYIITQFSCENGVRATVLSLITLNQKEKERITKLVLSN